MSGVRRFEDLVAWQKARILTRMIYEATASCSDFALSRQMQRSAVSIMANIAEGFERRRPREFHQYLSMAKASCAELRSHLYVALDNGILRPEIFQKVSDCASEVGRVIGGLKKTVAARRVPAFSELGTRNSELE